MVTISAKKDTRQMRLFHPVYATDMGFDEGNLTADAGLVPLLALAERAGLHRLLDERLSVAARKGPGADGPAKVSCIVAGMGAGADSIDDLDRLRHGALGEPGLLVGGVKAPSTLGTYLRAYRFGHVRQLDAVNSRFMLGLDRVSGLLAPLARPGAVTHVDVDAPPPFGREVPPRSSRCSGAPSRAWPTGITTPRA